MTYWKCPNCAGEDSTENDIVMKICPCCQIEMKSGTYNQKREVEVKGDGYRSEG